MRMRNKPWAAPELNACPFFVRNPAEHRGKWQDFFARRQPIHLELGCGKGFFIAGLAPQNPQINYMGIDLKDTVLAPAKRNIERAFLAANRVPDNVVLFPQDIERIFQALGPQDTVERIYINFCNPWPKPRHRKRRLTYPRQLESYQQFLRRGGEIHFKTDDDGLFADSLSYFAQSGFQIKWQTADLHALNLPQNVLTEHEIMFMEKGIKIKALIAEFVP
ncbi:MAG: tRNA (guanosine(46)-N7)-methyltransferase TrmB [Clostridiales bacterium]|nr:tRNA (guanosine(46)-N7)-methyltransferase TrmB [Clostridiales bacterium]